MIAVDFDKTLSLDNMGATPNQPLIDFLRGKKFDVVTARRDHSYNRKVVEDFLERNGLIADNIYFIGRKDKDNPRNLKGVFLKQIGAQIFIDDLEEQRKSAEESGVKAFHPESQIKELNEYYISISKNRLSAIKSIFLKYSL
jgi:hypothetical protein